MKVIIIGGRGTSTVIADQITDAHERFGMNIEVLGFALDDLSGGTSIAEYPILCGIRELHEKYGQYTDVNYIYCLYRSDVIKERSDLLYSLNFPIEKFCNFIHPSSLVTRSAQMGHGNVFLANVVINSNVRIGNFNIFNTGTIVCHDSMVGNNNFFAAHICVGSSTNIGNTNFIGMKSTIRGNLNIGNNNYIGMGSNVVKIIQNNTLVYGNPAREHTKN